MYDSMCLSDMNSLETVDIEATFNILWATQAPL